jgi:predicted transposase YdaD
MINICLLCVPVQTDELFADSDTASPETFIRELARHAPQHEEVLMTIAQKLEQKGLERGLEKGRLEGIQPGEAKGRQEGGLRVNLPLPALCWRTVSIAIP